MHSLKIATLAAATLMFAFAACGKKEEPQEPPAGAQSTYGKMLESAEETAKKANERTEKVRDAAGE